MLALLLLACLPGTRLESQLQAGLSGCSADAPARITLDGNSYAVSTPVVLNGGGCSAVIDGGGAWLLPDGASQLLVLEDFDRLEISGLRIGNGGALLADNTPTTGLTVTNVRDVEVHGVLVQGLTGTGILIDGETGAHRTMAQVHVHDNELRDVAIPSGGNGDALRVHAPDWHDIGEVWLSDNVIDGVGQPGEDADGIQLQGAFDAVWVQGNQVSGCGLRAIKVQSGDVFLDDNDLSDSVRGVAFTHTDVRTNVAVTHNRLTGLSGNAVDFSGPWEQVEVAGNTITDAHIGLYQQEGAQLSGLRVEDNDFSGLQQNGVLLRAEVRDADLQHNSFEDWGTDQGIARDKAAFYWVMGDAPSEDYALSFHDNTLTRSYEGARFVFAAGTPDDLDLHETGQDPGGNTFVGP